MRESGDVTPERPAGWGRPSTALFFVLVSAILFLSDKGHISGDGSTRWAALVALADENRLTSDRYTLEVPLASLPLWFAGDAVAHAQGLTGSARLAVIEHAVGRFNKFVALGIAAWLYLSLRRDLSRRVAACGVFGLLFLTALIPSARDYYSECLWTLLVCAALTLLARERTTGGEKLGLLAAVALTIPLNPLLAPVLVVTAVSGLLFARGRMRPAWDGVLLVAIGAGVGVCVTLAENLARRGSMFDLGYAGEGFSTPFLEGLSGQLISPARGALFYLPTFFLGPILLASRRRDDETTRFVGVSTVFGALLILAYAKWNAWHGGTYWGPRFLLPLGVIGIVFLVLAWREFRGAGARASLVLLAASSFAAHKVGVAIGVTPFLSCRGEGCYWEWARLPLSSWSSRRDLAIMLADRSTAVELTALALFALFMARDRSRRASGPSEPESRSG